MNIFDNGTEDWTTYVERVEQFCLANEVEDEMEVVVLLSMMGGKLTTCCAASSHRPNKQTKVSRRPQRFFKKMSS